MREAHVRRVVEDFAVFDHDEDGIAIAHFYFFGHQEQINRRAGSVKPI